MSRTAAGPESGTRHPSAIVHPDAEVPGSVSIGPWSIVGPGVRVGERVRIDSHVVVERDTRIGDDVHLCKGAVLGTDPQDLKYAGESTWLEVGARTTIREYATLNRGTAASGITRVGDDCLVMAYAHVAHDCRIENHVVIANAVNMAGHIHIEDWAIVGGLTAIHQFVRIGCHSLIGGASRVPKDVAPFVIVAGSPSAAFGINSTGLKRRGFERRTLSALSHAYRRIFRSDLPLSHALDALEAEGGHGPEVRHLIGFIRASERGVTAGRRRGGSGE